MKRFIVTGWKSFAMWPTDSGISLDNEKNISEDKHATEEIAKGICRLLKRDGFGGDKKIFPLAAWYEPVIEEMVPTVKEPKAENVIKWKLEPAQGALKESLEGYDEDNLQVVFAVHYASGWCLITPRVSHFRTEDVEEVKHVAEQALFGKK